MSINIYKDMIEDSPIAYAHTKIIENELGEAISLDIINYNKAYERIVLRDNKITIDDLKKTIEDRYISKEWIDFHSKVKQNKKYTIEAYIDYAKSYFNIDAYYGGNNEFHFRLTKISNKQEELSSALKNAPFATWMKDRNGNYVDANQEYLNFLGTTYDEIIGKNINDFTTKEKAEEICEIEEHVMQQNELISYQEQSLTGKKYFEIIKWPYMDKKQTMVLGTFGMAIDVTEKLNLTKKLKETEKQFLEIANNINDIIVIRDEKKALYINSAFEKVYKFKPDELYEDINKWYEYWDEIEFDVGEPNNYSFEKPDMCTIRVSKKGQNDIWILSKFTPIFDENGKIVKKIGIVSDITEIKKMELEIDKIKMDFFANVSHELRTPINLILSALQVISLKIDKLDYETQEYFVKYFNIMGQNGNRLLRLVNNLIDTTRLDSGCFNYHPKNNDIVKCVEDICTSIVSFVNDNNLEIIFDTDIEEKIVAFDQENMERIILNLISNAIKFNKPNGKIEVTISCKDNIRVSVKDYGIGIPEDKIEDIFGRFEQVKNKFKKEREGSGIGLSLVKSLVEINGGNIVVKSKLGEGSEFIITLPDIIIENETINDIVNGTQNEYLSNENRLKIEFSDIY